MKDFSYKYQDWLINEHGEVWHNCGGQALDCVCRKCGQPFPIEVFYQFQRVWSFLEVIPDTTLWYAGVNGAISNPTKKDEPQPRPPSTNTF